MLLSKIYDILGLEFSKISENSENSENSSPKDIEISALNSLKNASNGELSYCDGESNIAALSQCNASAILVKNEHAHLVKNHAIISKNPHLDFAILSKFFSNPLFYEKKPSDIDKSANIMPNVYIGSGVKIGANTVIMAGAYIGDNVEIGQNTIIHPNVVIYNNSKIGDECVINANAVIGSDGFGFAHTNDGKHVKIYHNGNVVIGSNVEIGACTTIDRGVFESTVIADYSKIDNLVQIGHNCELGFGTILVSQVGLAGSSILGRNVVMGGQAGTKGHIKIGDFAQIAARGGVSKSIEGKKEYGGYPILELKDWFKLQAKIQRFFSKN